MRGGDLREGLEGCKRAIDAGEVYVNLREYAGLGWNSTG